MMRVLRVVVMALVGMVGAARVRELTGVTLNGTFKRAERVTSIEAMTDPEFGGPSGSDDPANAGRRDAPARHVTIDHVGLTTRVGDFAAGAGVRVISYQVNADLERVLPGFMVYENVLGGRVCVCPYDLTAVAYPWFLNWNRQRQMKAVLTWLFRGKLPLWVDAGAYALAIRTDYPTHVAVAVANASLDAFESLRVELAVEKEPVRVSQLRGDGSWGAVTRHHFEGGRLTIDLCTRVECADLVAVRVE
jgi:hypothetical protein